MSPRITLATAARVLAQLRRDHRTVALLLVLPILLLSLLRWMYDDSPATFDRVGPALLGVIPFTVMFLVTSIATLRERTSGTLERLLTMPMHKVDLLLGYGLAFGAVALVQAALATTLSLTALGLDAHGHAWLLGAVAVLTAVLGSACGLFVSAFARTEFQAVQFLPAVVLPQFLLCGLLLPRERMGEVLSAVSDALPLSYAVEAMTEVTTSQTVTGTLVRDMAVVGGCALLALLGGAATLRRRSA
jgi:ABC-2 type transport system permease protein